MNDINRTIKHFEALQKRYTTQHNGKMCERVADALEALKSVQKKAVERPRTGKSMKAKELAEWLLQYPDFDVSIIENGSPDGWPSYSEYDIELGDIGHSSKVMFIEKGRNLIK